MRHLKEITKYSSGPSDTVQLGRWLGQRLPAGTVIALCGQLGAGKTCLTQGLAQGLGVPDQMPVVSPTFVLVSEYIGRIPLYHLDVYRLDGQEFEDAGLDEYLHSRGLAVVEWAEKVADFLPETRLEVELTIMGHLERRLVLRAIGHELVAIIEELPDNFTKSTA